MNDSFRQILTAGAIEFNLHLSESQLQAFEQYAQELIVWNRRVNLTRIVDPPDIAVKHFLDSLSIAAALPDVSAPFSLIDVGTGAGFPGLPLKIALPHLRLTLLEATAKKTAFLRHLVDALNLRDVVVLTARAEEAGRQPDHRERYDVVAARAVAALSVLAEYMLPLAQVGGMMIAAKGQNPAAEVENAATALQTLGGRVEQILPVIVPGLDAVRQLVVIRKIAPTPARYPRRPGLPAKRPL